MHHIFLAILLLSQPPQPAIVGSEDIVPIGRLEFYDVTGITQEQFDKSQVLVRPRGYDTMVRVMYDRRGPETYQPVILFRADEANALQQYDLVVAYPDTEGVVQLLEWTIKTGEAPNPPPDPDPDTDWDVDGLHTMILDDENERGDLPSEQVQVFLSKPFRDWLDEHAKYRFSNVESLEPGSEARELESKEWVEGWDLLTSAVKADKVTLPAWIISNGKRGVIEPLPKSVDAAIQRLEEFSE